MSTRFPRSTFDVEHPGLVVLISLTHGFNEFYSVIVPPLFPFLVPALHIGYSRASLLVVVFFLTYSVVQLAVGPLSDVYSNRRVLAAGMIVLAAGIALVGIAPTFDWMLLGMVVAGIGGSTYHPTGMSLISDAESSETHGRSMGIHGMVGSLGTVTAPLLVVGIAEVTNWRIGLLAGSGVGVLFAIALYATYPRVRPDETAQRTDDLLEALRLAFGDDFDLRRQTARIWRYVTTPRILTLAALFVIVGAEVRAIQTFTASFAVVTSGKSEAFGGAMLSLTMLTAGAASMVAGAVVDRVNRLLFTAGTFVGTAIIVGGLVLLSLEPIGLAISFAILGSVLYSVYPAANAIAATATRADDSGSLFAVTNTASAVGGAVGPYLLGTVADATTVELAFLTTAGIAVVGVLVTVGTVLTRAL